MISRHRLAWAGLSAALVAVVLSTTQSGAAPRGGSQGMSLQELAGQRIVYAYAGLKPPPSLLSAIRAGEAGGVIFFGPNISSVAQIRGVMSRITRSPQV